MGSGTSPGRMGANSSSNRVLRDTIGEATTDQAAHAADLAVLVPGLRRRDDHDDGPRDRRKMAPEAGRPGGGRHAPARTDVDRLALVAGARWRRPAPGEPEARHD